MNDCSNVTMREMLPDLVNDRLEAQSRAEVEAHVKACADCRAELELLRRVRAAAPTPAIDASRIAARIAPYRATPAWVRASRSWPLRAAAAIIIVVGATTMLRNNDSSLGEPDSLLADAGPELSVSGLNDISDSELRALRNSIGALKAVPSTEPEVVVPAVGRGGN